MKQYASFDGKIVHHPITALGKLDGNNIRCEWDRKQGLHKFGSRKVLLGDDHLVMGRAPEMIREKYTEDLSRIFRDLRLTDVTCYFEFWGERSFAGQHDMTDPTLTVTLLDIDIYKKGVPLVRDFLKMFEGKVDIPPVLYTGNPTEEFLNSVRTGTLEGMPFEGVVCRETLNNPKTLRGILAAQEIHGVEGGGVNSTRPLFEAHMNPFLGAIHRAYEAHFPIVLGPDEVWTCIAQGFAMHVNENAETLRKRFVQHEGQKKLVVQLPFTKGDPNAPWSSALPCFSDAIAENLGPKQRELVVGNFSTTGPIERAASEIVLMGAMQKYFSYYGVTLCGIPEITLLGTPEDWKSVRDRASALAEYDLEWWTRELLPILDQFIAASEGRVDSGFWKSICKVQDGSGGPYISGWIVDLFPYLTKGHDGTRWRDAPLRNPFLGGATRGIRRGPTTDVFPMGLTRVAWDWNYLGVMFDMEFLGGFVGYTQDPDTYALRPALGWAVRDTKAGTRDLR